MLKLPVPIFLLALALLSCTDELQGSLDKDLDNCAAHNSDDPATVCAQFANAECGFYYRCSPSDAENWKSKEDCVTSEIARCSFRLSLPGTSFTPGRVWVAAQNISPTTCELLTSSASSCSSRGTLTANSLCSESSQCASGLCLVTSDPPCGTCTAIANEGDPCSSFGGCDEGLWCNNGLCAKKLNDGELCDDHAACSSRSACDNGVCVPNKAGTVRVGGACSTPSLCAFGLECKNNVCSEPSLGQEGDSCVIGGQDCASGLACSNGNCAAYVPSQDCSSYGGCAYGQYCKGSNCVDRASPGGSCTTSAECLPNLKCVNSLCVINGSQCK